MTYLDSFNIFNCSINQTKIKLNPLEYFIPNGLNEKSVIMISSKEDSGKTLLAINLAIENPESLFLYIDTTFKLKADIIPNNMYIFSSNDINDIKEYINSLNKNNIDFIMIDSLNNLKLNETETEYYIEFNKELMNLIQICSDINCCLILFNGLNMNNNPFGLNLKNIKQISLLLNIIDFNFDNKELTFKVLKNKFGPKNNYSIKMRYF